MLKKYLQLARGHTDVCDCVESLVQWTCPRCDKQFPSKRAAGMHAYRAHGIRRVVRWYVDGPSCPVCYKHFGNRPRALHHAQYGSRKCYDVILAGSLAMLSDERVAELDAQDTEHRKKAQKSGLSYLRVP